MSWYVYLLYEVSVTVPVAGRSGSRDTYVGISNDVYRRVARHNSGSVTATHGRQWKVVAFLNCHGRTYAAQIERWLKCGDSRNKRIKFRQLGLNAVLTDPVAVEICDAVDLWAKRHPALRDIRQEVET